MTRERDVDQILDHWFAERPTEVADRVLDEVAERIGRQPQQPAWLTLWRDSHVNSYLKYAAAVAAVILVAVVGFAVLRPSSGSNVGGGTATLSPSPVASPSPSTSPSASQVFPPWFTQASDGAGILPAGRQTTRQFLSGSTFTVPEGWVNDLDFAQVYALFPDTPANEAEYALSKQSAQNIVLTDTVQNNMFAICDATGLYQGATASEVIDFLVANKALSTTEPVDVTIGGLSGRQVDLQLSQDWAGTCTLNPDDPPTRDYTDARMRLIVLGPRWSHHRDRIVRYSADFRHSSRTRCRSSSPSSSTSRRSASVWQWRGRRIDVRRSRSRVRRSAPEVDGPVLVDGDRAADRDHDLDTGGKRAADSENLEERAARVDLRRDTRGPAPPLVADGIPQMSSGGRLALRMPDVVDLDRPEGAVGRQHAGQASGDGEWQRDPIDVVDHHQVALADSGTCHDPSLPVGGDPVLADRHTE
jgi:hypothetical protein